MQATEVDVIDFEVRYDGSSIFLLDPLTDTARQWLEENTQGELRVGSAWVVEHRYIQDLVDALFDAGYVVACRRS